MLYLSQMMGRPVVDSAGEKIGTISDLAISTGEVFPRITSLAFQGPGRVPFMISWRKYVDKFDEDGITLAVEAPDIRFSYLQPEEVLLARDLLNRQIVDTQGMKVVRVNDLKLSVSGSQLRLLGAEVGARGILRGLHPIVEKAVVGTGKLIGHKLEEQIIAWNYMDLLDRDLSDVQLSVTHKRLDELHPADIADILEQLDPQQRANVFQHLDEAQATEAISEMEDEYQADFIEDLDPTRAAGLLGSMDPDDAADIVRDLSYEKAETLLRLLGAEDATEIRRLLGYKDGTAGGMMTTQYVAVESDTTVSETIEILRELPDDHPTVHYVYVLDEYEKLVGLLSLRTLVLTDGSRPVGDVMFDDVISVTPEETEEDVAADIFKYDVPAMPVVDEHGVMLGIVTTEDAWDAIEEDVAGDKTKASVLKGVGVGMAVLFLLVLYTLILLQIFTIAQVGGA
ncbi:magnesium transporter [Xiamenia xianingshaonis]|uniref:CBS domain-containing protein n=1 Tax=Xiamenia xianingshaonis TaxID=2682776 RepID=A0A9E6SUG9_9ACTN|nr:CBS domain-containing protein [Xiamenia xianingshaonis]NGM18349.1 CBS domain-containing protein [Eggerthellaceae bacterium zg-893]NHM14150.1 CBS domain-containing protein [Xiamenia xianingshaonis]NHM15770.1 CBS domain-containing protein [Xiamenia xianingshaonis]QTU84232.1 magnesium transporter [Xiamenia xianingshaonis]